MKFNFLEKNRNKVLADLTLFIDNLINERNALSERLAEYKKEEEVAKLLEANNKLRIMSLHFMSEQEQKDAREFSSEHYNSCKSNVQYIVEGTGIGDVITVKCKKCGKEKNITDYDCW